MNNESKTNPSRRRLIRRLAAGGGLVAGSRLLPEHWTRPVVDGVLLPAHAQTSCACQGLYCHVVPGQPVTLIIDVAGGQLTVSTETPAGISTGTGVCTGGSFSIITTGPEQWTVSGQIAADCSEITGTIVLNPSFGFPFTANNANCQQAVNCIAHGTPVLLPGDRYRAIEALQVGDMVTALGDDGQPHFTVVTKVVTEHLRRDHYVINGDLRITDDHPLRVVENGVEAWRRVDLLAIGDRIRTLDGTVGIQRIDYHPSPLLTVYVETQCGSFIVDSGGDRLVVKSTYVTTVAETPAKLAEITS